MERVRRPPPPPPPVQPPPLRSSQKVERRIVEKNRRNHMKGLYSELYSLLPSYSSKEVLPVPEQIDEAVQYIKRLQVRIEKSKEKKEKLMRRKRPHSCIVTSEKNETSSTILPRFEIHEMGPSMDVVFISGLEDQAKFYSILHSLDEEGFEVVHANFSRTGNSTLQISHARVGKSTVGIRDTTVAGRIKELIYGNSHNDLESNLDLWDYEIEPDIWGSELILDTMPMLGVGEFSLFNRDQESVEMFLP